MKSIRQLLTLLLSVYLLALMGVPCRDDHSHTTTTTIAVEKQLAQEDNHGHEADNCTPFCVCACCTTPIVVQQLFTFQPVIFHAPYNRNVISFYQPVASSYFGSIWQPPQIV